MHIKKKLLIKTSYFIAIILFCFSVFNIKLNANGNINPLATSRTECKVAYFTEPNFFEEITDNKGNLTRRLGYAYDYLQTIGQYENINFSYLKIDRASGIEKLINNEVDMILGVSKTYERVDAGILYPQLPMGSETYYLYSKEDNSNKYEDYSDLYGKTVAVEKGTILVNELEKWNSENELSLNIVEFEGKIGNNFDEILSTCNCDILAYCDLYLNASSNLHPICELSASEIYLAVNSERSDLLSLINDAQSSIIQDNQSYLTDLANRYYSDTPSRRMLSTVEKAWISQNKVIDVGYYDYYPFVNGESEDVKGAFVNILNQIFEIFDLELEFNFYKYTEYSLMLEDLKNGVIDMVMPSYGSIYKAENENVLVTNTVVTSSIKLIYTDSKCTNLLNNDLSNYTVAIVKDSPLHLNFVNEYMSDCTRVYCSDLNECLNMVKSGKADFTFVSNYRQSLWLSEKNNFIVEDTNLKTNYKIALASDYTSLLSILNRGLSIIGSENIQNIIVSYIEGNQVEHFSITNFIKDHVITSIILIVALVVVLITALYWCISKTRLRHNLEYQAVHDSLTGILNRRAYDHAIENIKKHPLDNDFVVYVSDIDNLKVINDSIGHDAGDELIKTYARIANKYLSPLGLFYRTGGDEFIGLLYGDKEKLKEVTDIIVEECLNYKGDLIEKVEFSYGATFANDFSSPNINNLLNIAEERMYDLKTERKKQSANTFSKTKAKFNLDTLTNLYMMEEFYYIYNDFNNHIYKLNQNPVILAFNINSFKRYNKKYGFDEGSKLLIDVSRLLEKYFGKNRCARFAEDKFFVIAPNVNIEEKIEDIFKEFKNTHLEKFATLRVGICEIKGREQIDIYCDRARLACDSDKSDYESHYIKFSDILGDGYEMRQYILENIDKAIENNEIIAYFQPKFNPYTNKLTGFESLARWISKDKGFISPGDFIPVLDEFNITYKVDLEILRQIAINMRKVIGKGLKVVPVSFNISRVDFNAVDIRKEINDIVDSYNLPHKYFQIEITETTVLSNIEFIKEEIRKFKNDGYDVLMDDFGSAYSSLATLREIDFDEIKIDSSFMFNFTEKSQTILTIVINLCKELKIKTCVEGVESYNQVLFLKKLKADEIQGYYYGKPENVETCIKKYILKD